MSQKKAKKKKPLDIYERKYNYAEVQEISEKLANAKALEIYKKRAAHDIDRAIQVSNMLTLIILEDLYNFGGGRLLAVREEIERRWADYGAGLFSLDDILEINEGIEKKCEKWKKRRNK